MIVDRIKRSTVRRARKVIGSLRSLLGLSYRSRLGEDDVFAMFRGRTVAVVGNASSLSEADYGADIDAHDIVIRFNASPVPSRVSHGARTTIIATSIIIEYSVVAERRPEHVFAMSPAPGYLPHWLASRPDFFLYPLASHVALMQEIGARPTTGLMIIDLLRRSDCASVDLYGFDFFGSASLSDGKLRKSTPHDFDAERTMVAGLLSNDARFRLNNPAVARN